MDREPDSQRPREAETIADLDTDPGDAKKLSTIGRYVILDSVGMGGMGLVCAAYDPKLNRKIALKLLRNASSDEASTAGRNRLFREAQALAKLSHPNVVTVHDVDVFEGQVYIAMEFVEGATLREWLREQPRTWKQILDKFILAGRGLAAAHQADIVHRDFKPSNVLISNEGEVRVADFGVAKESDRPQREGERLDVDWRRRTAALGDADITAQDALIEEIQSNVSLELTVAGRMVGTPAYMAPEQHMGLHVGPYTDQYSFCVSLYEALYGRLPFEGTDRRDQLAKMAEGKLPPPPKEGNVRGVPSWLHKVVAKGLRPHPSERWPSMPALLSALARDRNKRLRRAAVLAVGVLGLSAGVFGLVFGLGEDNHCPALRDDIAEHWDEQRSQELQRVFSSSSQPYAHDAARRVLQTFDHWAEDWADSRVAICEATRRGEQSQVLLDTRIYCLDQRARELDAMVELFLEGDDEIIERSVAAAHALGDPGACANVRDTGEIAERKLDSIDSSQLEALEADLNRAFALASAEKYGESLPLQARAVTRARELHHSRTLARALYDLAESQLETGQASSGEASLREAIELSAKLGDAEREAYAWLRLIFYIGSRLHRFEQAHAWELSASSALERTDASAKLDIRLEGALGALALAEGRWEPAIEHYGRGLQLSREEFGEDHPITIRMMMNYGASLARVEARLEDAKQALLEAVSRSKEVYGPAHPWLAKVYVNLGSIYWVTEQHEEAEIAFRQALEIRERVGGPEAANLANPVHMLAKISFARERHEEALLEFERALAIHIRAKGENSDEAARVLFDIAATQQTLGRHADARATFDRVESIYAKIYPKGHAYVAGLEKRRCKLFIEAQLWVEAVEACERALELDERFDVEPKVLLEVNELLLEAEQGRGRAVAVERVKQRIAELEQQIAEPAAKKP